MDWQQYIQAYARSHGCTAGCCGAAVIDSTRGTAAPFVSRDYAKRTDPSICLPGAKSVIVLAKGHARSALLAEPDYHDAIRAILESLAHDLQTVAGLTFRYTIRVDGGTLMERPLAVRAGLGWWGRHGNVVSPEFGAFFNIGCLLTDCAAFCNHDPNAEHDDWTQLPDCAQCRLCVAACPGGAIRAHGFAIDPAKCLSYLTQKKGILTDGEMTRMGTQLFGCDECRAACPYGPNPASESLLPADVLVMDAAAYQERFGHTAAAWRGYAVLLRNALVVLGNTVRQSHAAVDKDIIRLVMRHLSNTDAAVAGAAAYAMAQIKKIQV